MSEVQIKGQERVARGKLLRQGLSIFSVLKVKVKHSRGKAFSMIGKKEWKAGRVERQS